MKKCLVPVCAGAAVLALQMSIVRGDDSPLLAEKQQALTVGQPLGALESIDESGQPWKLADHVGHKVLVFYFYPGDFTGGCNKQAQSFREGLKRLEDLDVEVVGVSGDEAATHRLFRASHGLSHTLLADPAGVLAAQLGIPVRQPNVPTKVRAIDLDRKPLLDEQGQPIIVERKITFPRWTLIFDRKGILVSKRTQVDPAKDADEVQKIVESISTRATNGSGADALTK